MNASHEEEGDLDAKGGETQRRREKQLQEVVSIRVPLGGNLTCRHEPHQNRISKSD